MTKVIKIILISSIFFSSAQVVARAQISSWEAETIISRNTIERKVAYLCDTICSGRGTGTLGAAEAATWIGRQFQAREMLPVGGRYYHSFKCQDGLIGRNVIGMIPGNKAGRDRYVVLMAHYDNLGILQGNQYPGADSNASGVASLLSIAEMIHYMNTRGKIYGANIIFVATDAKQLSMAGAEALWKEIKDGKLTDPVTGARITKDKIKVLANMDIIGSTMEPLKSGRKDFIIMLGGDKFRNTLHSANVNYDTNLELSFDYYGSKDFTNMFLNRIGDQKVFLENGINSVLFTSGITMNTNKKEDLPDTIDYDILHRRCVLIFHWFEKVIQEL